MPKAEYEKLTNSIATLRMEGANRYRLVQFRVHEDYFNNSAPGSMPMLALMFNGDVSTPVNLMMLSADARKIGRALIETAERMEARFAERSSEAYEREHGKDGIQPSEAKSTSNDRRGANL